MKRTPLHIAIGLLAASIVTKASADVTWQCKFPSDKPEHHTYVERPTGFAEVGVPIFNGRSMENGEIEFPHFTRTAYDIFAARAWPVLSAKPHTSLAGATILIIDLRTLDATLTQIVTSVKAGGIARGTCRRAD